MPAPAKVSDDEVVRAARRLVDRHGQGALSMNAVADEVGVRTPSLYKRFADRAALLAAVQRQVFADVEELLDAAAARRDPQVVLMAMAKAYRGFAKSHPHLYELMYSTEVPHDAASDEARRLAAQPIVSRLASWIGQARALPVARVLTAFVHGFVSMELHGAFRLGGNPDDAFLLGLDLLLSSLPKS